MSTLPKLISLHEALAFIENNAHVLGHQDCKLEHAHNRVLAQDIRAATTLPPLSVSAMDGYAVNDDGDLAQGAALSVIGTSPAGNPFTGPIDKNQCVRIYTGGAVPPGANRVIMQENVTRVGDIITLSEPLSPALHIRAAGIDFHQGDRIADQGTRLDAYGLAQIAAANIDTVTVYKRPKVALIANGDELVKPGSELKSGQIISSNAYALSALIKAWGAEPIDAGISIDDPAAIRQQIHECGDVDLFVPVGGASVGDRDYMRTVFAEMGYTKIFEKVAVKPGKPVWFGQMDSALVLGLPGNPASALVCAQIFLKPLLFALLGDQAPANTPHFARTTTSLNAPGWRTSFIRAFAYIDQSGCVHVTRADNQDSSLLTPFRNSNCFIRQDADTASIAAGELVEIVPIKPI